MNGSCEHSKVGTCQAGKAGVWGQEHSLLSGLSKLSVIFPLDKFVLLTGQFVASAFF